MKSQHRALLSAVDGINKETKHEVILMGDFNFQVSQLKFDFSQFSPDDNQSGPVNSDKIRDVPVPHGHTTKYADKFVKEMESINLLLLTGLVGKAETSREGIGRPSLLDYVFCSPQLLSYASNYFTWPRYLIPYSDHNLITFDLKLSDSYFHSVNHTVRPQLKFEWKRKVDMSPVAHSFPELPVHSMNSPVDDLLTFFYDTYCPIIDTLAKKNTNKTTRKHPGFIHDHELKQLKIQKNKLLHMRNLHKTFSLQDRQTIKDKLKIINNKMQKRLNYVKNERRKKDLLQVNVDMKRNPKKAWSILKGGARKGRGSQHQIFLLHEVITNHKGMLFASNASSLGKKNLKRRIILIDTKSKERMQSPGGNADEYAHKLNVQKEADKYEETTGGSLYCKACDWTFATKFSYRRHAKTHTGERPWGCVYCWRYFSEKSALKKHLACKHKQSIRSMRSTPEPKAEQQEPRPSIYVVEKAVRAQSPSIHVVEKAVRAQSLRSSLAVMTPEPKAEQQEPRPSIYVVEKAVRAQSPSIHVVEKAVRAQSLRSSLAVMTPEPKAEQQEPRPSIYVVEKAVCAQSLRSSLAVMTPEPKAEQQDPSIYVVENAVRAQSLRSSLAVMPALQLPSQRYGFIPTVSNSGVGPVSTVAPVSPEPAWSSEPSHSPSLELLMSCLPSTRPALSNPKPCMSWLPSTRPAVSCGFRRGLVSALVSVSPDHQTASGSDSDSHPSIESLMTSKEYLTSSLLSPAVPITKPEDELLLAPPLPIAAKVKPSLLEVSPQPVLPFTSAPLGSASSLRFDSASSLRFGTNTNSCSIGLLPTAGYGQSSDYEQSDGYSSDYSSKGGYGQSSDPVGLPHLPLSSFTSALCHLGPFGSSLSDSAFGFDFEV
eukprot:g82160.t1